MSERSTRSQSELIEHRAKRVMGMEELIGAQLRPPSLEDEERLYLMTPEELNERFEHRVELFQRLLDIERGGAPLTEQEKHAMKMWLKAVNGMDRYVTEALSEETECVLTDEQLQVFQAIHAALEAGHSSGFVQLPTGGGKTVIFSEMIEAMGVPTLVVVPTIDLVTQTRERLGQFAPSVDTGVVMSGVKNVSEDATVITYDSFCNLVENGELDPNQFSCLILDEAHLALSPRRQEVVNRFSHAIRIGFTATPDYTEGKKLSDLLPKEIHRLSILEAVEKRVICGFRVILAQTKVSIDGVKTTAKKGYDQKQLEKAINVEGRNRAAVELYKKLANNGQKAIVFCAGVKHAEDVAKMFREQGVTAEHAYGTMKKQERKEVLKRSKSGETKVLCGADLLVCGYDDPEIELVFLLVESQSVVRVTQSAGRGLRQKFDAQGVPMPKQATIIQFMDRYSSPEAAPVLFPDIAGGAVILPSGNDAREGEGDAAEAGGERAPLPKIDVAGLKVVTDAAEVMRVTRETVRAKELFGIRPNEDGWFAIEGRDFGTIQRCAKEAGMTPKAATAYIEQAEKGGRAFTTEEKHGDKGVIDLFLRAEMVEFLRERSGASAPSSPISTQERQGELAMRKYDEMPAEPILFSEGEKPACEIAGTVWASVEQIARLTSLPLPTIRGWLTKIKTDITPLTARREMKTKKRNNTWGQKTEDVELFPMDVVERERESIEAEWTGFSQREEAKKQRDKALRERILTRGWLRHGGTIYVNVQWIEANLRPHRVMPAFNMIASKVLQLPKAAIRVGGFKFYPIAMIYKAYKTVPHSGSDFSKEWRDALVEPLAESFVEEEGEEAIEIDADK